MCLYSCSHLKEFQGKNRLFGGNAWPGSWQNKVRKSDCFGGFEEGTLGVILLCASAKRACIALERLRFEALLCLSGGRQGMTLKTSYVIFPSEANSLDSLCELATQRLTEQEPKA